MNLDLLARRAFVAPMSCAALAGCATVLTYENFIVTSCGGAQVDLAAGETAFVANVLKMTQVSNRVYVLCTTAPKLGEEALKVLAGLRGVQ